MKVRLPLQYHNKDTNDPIKDTKIEILIKINHNGEVNKARHMPQRSNIIATKTVSGEIHLFDYFKHPTKPSDNLTKPNLILQGHKKEGFGLSWSNIKDGYLISGSDDYKVHIF
jgi:histone-binding protein RBBP4